MRFTNQAFWVYSSPLEIEFLSWVFPFSHVLPPTLCCFTIFKKFITKGVGKILLRLAAYNGIVHNFGGEEIGGKNQQEKGDIGEENWKSGRKSQLNLS